MSETEKKQISEQEETKNEQIREMGQQMEKPKEMQQQEQHPIKEQLQ